ncbi:DUF4287 domain-containing protein [Actinobacteria bacterium YIM 96077]|uniref:DUF4287 domain-containing protein n=1 Tax=Phytoactinopolyspora halophila TaxID=1981511 RepID=A0A329QSV3_9ACTN|nr:DUF4287 domain-containing protein [Phytoactinopolyspora halophila]AYY12314.1 DUF4287 domain-containing protein [Actinobacteria bacterium YIM 96077]RAW13768.1 hypothetical protein DPM12_12235 [Phytoactinopolyspora halophila]
MTRQKSLKSRVRARMDKTGESYTTARRQVLGASTRESTPDTTRQEAPDSASENGVRALRRSEASVQERTGRGWDQWFSLLDGWDATSRTHTEIAAWLVEEHGVPGWWAQSITVAYEQERGMRAPGQRTDGTFSANASKTIAVPVQRLFEAFDDADLRQQWLPGARLDVRTATPPKTFRADWNGEASRIVVGFTTMGETKARVAIEHEKLPGAEAAAEMKAYWRERFAVLKQLLEHGVERDREDPAGQNR